MTGSIGRTDLESVFDSWKWKLSEYIQTKSEYIASGESKSFGEDPYSHRQTEMLQNNLMPYL
jgi:hypothetical protein